MVREPQGTFDFIRRLLGTDRPPPQHSIVSLPNQPPAQRSWPSLSQWLLGGEGRTHAVQPEARPQSTRAVIKLAMETGTQFKADYTRISDARTLEYTLRPYEVKPHPWTGIPVLYAQCHKHGPEIHSFYLHNITNAENRFERPYVPDWPTVRPESV